MFFTDMNFNISKIHSIINFSLSGIVRQKYPGKLPTYELQYCCNSNAVLTFNGRSFNITPNTIIYLPKGIDNSDYTVKSDNGFLVYNIYFDTTDTMPSEAIIFQNKSDEIKSLFEKMYREWFKKADGYYFGCMQKTYRVFEIIKKQQFLYNTSQALSKLSIAEKYIAEHYCDNDFNIQKLHILADLSYSYFKKIFIDKYSMPPVKYVTMLRIHRACELLQTNKFTISQVAQMCGYENIYYFSNVFKKQIGVSPKNYKKFVY